jgi:hypothetical protein
MIDLSFLRTINLDLNGTFGSFSENSFDERKSVQMNFLTILNCQNLTEGFWPAIQTESIWKTSSMKMETIGISITSNRNLVLLE